MSRQHAPVLGGRVGVGVEVEDPDAARPADLGDRGGRRPGDRVVASQDDRDRAGLRDLAHLPIDEGVAALDPGGDDVGVAGVDHRQDLERLHVAELQRVDRAGRVVRLPDGPRAEPRAGPVADGVVEGRPDDRHVDAAPEDLRRVGDPRKAGERPGPDVGRQVEVRECLEVAVPPIRVAEVGVRERVGGTPAPGSPCGGIVAVPVGHAKPPGDRAADRAWPGRRGMRRSPVRAPPVRVRRPAGRPRMIARAGLSASPYASPRNSRQAAATRAGSARRSRAVWATSVAARSVVSSARGVAAASRDSMECHGTP